MAEFEISREILRTSNWVRAQESAVLTESSISSGSSRGWVERNSLHRCEKRGIQKYSVRCQSSQISGNKDTREGAEELVEKQNETKLWRAGPLERNTDLESYPKAAGSLVKEYSGSEETTQGGSQENTP